MTEEEVEKRCKLEGYAICITGEYLHSALRLCKETKRNYVFIKYGVKITIPKRIMREYMEVAQLEAQP
jgi:hypothetical protein